MNLQGIVAVSGKPGLWKALAQNKTGFILESLDENKTKLVANLSTAKIAALDEITVFGTDEDLKLTDVFANMQGAGDVPDGKADGKVMRKFFREVAPDHDEEKVYASDMKKILTWYHLLKDTPYFEDAPVAEEAEPAEEATAPEIAEAPVVEPTEEKAPETVAETEEPAKPKAKKKAKE